MSEPLHRENCTDGPGCQKCYPDQRRVSRGAPNPTGLVFEPFFIRQEIRHQVMSELATLAMMIALEAPARFSKVGYTTAVNRATVARIREVLDTNRIDWKTKHKQLRSKAK